MSKITRTKFNLTDIQNATLSGGVAISSISNTIMGPGYATVVGTIAGVIAGFCFTWVHQNLQKYIRFFDTRGVLYLHGVQGIFGAIVGMIAIGNIEDFQYGTPKQVLLPPLNPLDEDREPTD